MNNFEKPIVIVSSCLEFDSCRYNGELIPNEFVRNLSRFVNFKPICPEVSIGLGIPRDPIRIVENKNSLELIQPTSGKNLTKKINDFSTNYLNNLEVDGFILKSRSPSCGIKDAKIFGSADSKITLRKQSGFFASRVIEKFPHLPIEHEGRLTNFRIREHFLTRIFLFARFRKIIESKSISELINFHTRNKLLLMSYNQSKLKVLGNIVANNRKDSLKNIFNSYKSTLYKSLIRLPSRGSNINVMLHGFGYFSKHLKPKEKGYFLDLLESYKNGKTPLSANLAVLKAWIIKFEENYLINQSFFAPYPEELIEISDSGIGRKL